MSEQTRRLQPAKKASPLLWEQHWRRHGRLQHVLLLPRLKTYWKHWKKKKNYGCTIGSSPAVLIAVVWREGEPAAGA